MIGRYIFSIVTGVVITLSLLFVMQLLIVTGKQALTEPRERFKLEFVRVKRNETLNTEDLTPEKPPKPANPRRKPRQTPNASSPSTPPSWPERGRPASRMSHFPPPLKGR